MKSTSLILTVLCIFLKARDIAAVDHFNDCVNELHYNAESTFQDCKSQNDGLIPLDNEKCLELENCIWVQKGLLDGNKNMKIADFLPHMIEECSNLGINPTKLRKLVLDGIALCLTLDKSKSTYQQGMAMFSNCVKSHVKYAP